MTDGPTAQPKPLLSPEEVARLNTAFAEIGRAIRESIEEIVRGLATALQPQIDAVRSLHAFFESNGLYDADPADIGLLPDCEDDDV